MKSCVSHIGINWLNASLTRMQNCLNDQIPGQEDEEAQGTMTPITVNELSLQHPQELQGQVQVQVQPILMIATAPHPHQDKDEYRHHAGTEPKCPTVTGYLKMSEG